MKTPVCSICLNSGILCRTCMDKVKTGVISDTDVKVSRILLELSGKIRPLKDFTLVKVIESVDLVVIVCEKGDASKAVGKSGLTAKRFEKELGKRVVIVERVESVEEAARELLKPARISSINKLYRNGNEVLKVVTNRSDKPRISPRDFKDIIKLMFGKEVEISD